MGKPADKSTVFYCYRWLALLGVGNQCREIFWFSVLTFRDIMCSFQSASAGDIDTILVAGVGTWRNNAVACKQNRPVETFKLLLLFPPSIPVVSCQMFVFLLIPLMSSAISFYI